MSLRHQPPGDFDEINDHTTAVGMEVDDPVGVFADAEVDGSEVDGSEVDCSEVDGSKVDLDGSEVDGDDVSVGGAFKALVLHNDDDEEEDDEQEQERQGGSEANDGDARHDLINQNINMRVDAHADADADADGPSVQLQRAGKGKKKEKKEGLLDRIRREKLQAYCKGGALCTEYDNELKIGAEKRRSNYSSSTVARHAHMLADSVVDDIFLAKMLAAERGGAAVTRLPTGPTAKAQHFAVLRNHADSDDYNYLTLGFRLLLRDSQGGGAGAAGAEGEGVQVHMLVRGFRQQAVQLGRQVASTRLEDMPMLPHGNIGRDAQPRQSQRDHRHSHCHWRRGSCWRS